MPFPLAVSVMTADTTTKDAQVALALRPHAKPIEAPHGGGVLNGEQSLVTTASDAQHLHVLGLKYAECVEAGKKLSLQKAVILWHAKTKYGRLGCDSQFGGWLRLYAPDIDRKSADRLVNIVERFTGGNADNLSGLQQVVENFRLTALYALSSRGVPSKAREEALMEAKAGSVITPTRASELIAQHSPPALLSPVAGDVRKARTSPIKRKDIRVAGGRVVVSADDGDFLGILKAALTQVKRQPNKGL